MAREKCAHRPVGCGKLQNQENSPAGATFQRELFLQGHLVYSEKV